MAPAVRDFPLLLLDSLAGQSLSVPRPHLLARKLRAAKVERRAENSFSLRLRLRLRLGKEQLTASSTELNRTEHHWPSGNLSLELS